MRTGTRCSSPKRTRERRGGREEEEEERGGNVGTGGDVVRSARAVELRNVRERVQRGHGTSWERGVARAREVFSEAERRADGNGCMAERRRKG